MKHSIVEIIDHIKIQNKKQFIKSIHVMEESVNIMVHVFATKKDDLFTDIVFVSHHQEVNHLTITLVPTSTNNIDEAFVQLHLWHTATHRIMYASYANTIAYKHGTSTDAHYRIRLYQIQIIRKVHAPIIDSFFQYIVQRDKKQIPLLPQIYEDIQKDGAYLHVYFNDIQETHKTRNDLLSDTFRKYNPCIDDAFHTIAQCYQASVYVQTKQFDSSAMSQIVDYANQVGSYMSIKSSKTSDYLINTFVAIQSTQDITSLTNEQYMSYKQDVDTILAKVKEQNNIAYKTGSNMQYMYNPNGNQMVVSKK